MEMVHNKVGRIYSLVLIELIHALLCVFKEDFVSDMESDLFCLLLLVSLTLNVGYRI